MQWFECLRRLKVKTDFNTQQYKINIHQYSFIIDKTESRSSISMYPSNVKSITMHILSHLGMFV